MNDSNQHAHGPGQLLLITLGGVHCPVAKQSRAPAMMCIVVPHKAAAVVTSMVAYPTILVLRVTTAAVMACI